MKEKFESKKSVFEGELRQNHSRHEYGGRTSKHSEFTLVKRTGLEQGRHRHEMDWDWKESYVEDGDFGREGLLTDQVLQP